MPSSLANHAKHSADVSLYLEGTGNSRMFENLSENTLLGSIFPLFDPPLAGLLRYFLTIKPGNIKIEAHNYCILPAQVAKHAVAPLEMINQIPGDAPLVARISLPEDRFQHFLLMASTPCSNFYLEINWVQILICQDSIWCQRTSQIPQRRFCYHRWQLQD